MSVYFSDNPGTDLKAYAGTYLQQEIMAEGTARNIPAFSCFLGVAAFCNATIVNFTNVPNDAQVARTTVYEYFDILKDTLLLRKKVKALCVCQPGATPPPDRRSNRPAVHGIS